MFVLVLEIEPKNSHIRGKKACKDVIQEVRRKWYTERGYSFVLIEIEVPREVSGI